MRPPYPQLARAKREMTEQHPEATRVHALWTPNSQSEIHVEIWRGRHARVLPWEPKR